METPKTHVNVKLHGYLRKALSESDYKRLCTPSCEPAMVETEQESRVHKYVFFSDALLYLLDHSMKGQPIVLCAVEDILQIKHVSSSALVRCMQSLSYFSKFINVVNGLIINCLCLNVFKCAVI